MTAAKQETAVVSQRGSLQSNFQSGGAHYRKILAGADKVASPTIL
jgi:hypothetical protein